MIIDIFGVISEDYWGDESTVSLKSIRSQLENYKKDDELIVYINSPGGNVFEGIAIYNLLAEYKPTIKIIGEASSIASVIACAGEKVMMAETALMLFHKPWTRAWGNEDDLEKISKQLKTIKNAIAVAYKTKTGLSDEKIENLLNEDTYHDAKKCKEFGFVDEIYSPTLDESVKALSVINKISRKFFNLSKNHFTPQTKGDIVDYQALYNEEKAKVTAMTKDIDRFQESVKALEGEKITLTAENSKLTSEIQKLQDAQAKMTESINALQSKELEHQVDLEILALKDKILPAENSQENNFALKNELLTLKKLEANEDMKVNGKTLYAKRLDEIKARKSMAVLTQPINAVNDNPDSVPHKLDYNDDEHRAIIHKAAKKIAKEKNIPFHDALKQVTEEQEAE
jgi:ATP-dependent Clp protease protease subunit